ncbi:MAG: Internalin-A precursor [Lentisphaerae bacterium ADurb.Bin082]|nr:MAG: Internalin-A precursor [Lentisphaerae bacterium ADurb.Bin082]
MTRIGNGAFSGCSGLTSVVIGDGVTLIGNGAFFGCSGLTSVVIPDGVTSIGPGPFASCSSLIHITVALENPAYCSVDNVLFDKNQTVLLQYPAGQSGEYQIPDSVTSIGDDAFSGCSGLTSVVIPDGVTSIGYSAFYNCSGLTSVVIPDGVTSIGHSAFYGCTGLTSVVIPDGVTRIGGFTFRYCRSLTSVVIPDSVTCIDGWGAFAYCSGLTSVVIPDSVTSIGGATFEFCSSLTSVVIGNSVTSIGEYVFKACSSLASVVIPDSVTRIDNYAFEFCSGLASVVIGNSVTSIGKSAFSGCSGLASVVIGNSVTSIGKSAFYRCSGLTSVVIPDSVTCIERGAFYDCTGLTSVVIGNSVTNIGDDAFYRCSGLTSVVIPDSVTSIGDCAFSGCSGLTSVVIGDGVTSIGKRAFASCSSLIHITVALANPAYCSADNVLFDKNQTVLLQCPAGQSGEYQIPDSVTSIGDDAFSGCSGLTSVVIPDSVTSIEMYAFSDCTGLTSVVIPDSVTSIGEYAFYSCTGLTSVVIGNSVTSIGDGTFFKCFGLTSMVIPDSVTSIGTYAFCCCFGLSGIYFLGAPPETRWEAFSGVPGRAYYIFGTAGWGEVYDRLPTAVWSSEASFDGNGGTPDYATHVYNVGKAYGTLPAANRPGYTFADWWSALDDGVPVTTDTLVPLITTGHTLYAKWTINRYTIAFNSDGGTPVADITQDYGTAVTAPANPTRDGYAFVGWEPAVPAVMPADDTLCVAQWREINTYTVTFEPGEHGERIGGGELQQRIVHGEAALAPEIEAADGWEFIGWDQEFTKVTEDMTITARYDSISPWGEPVAYPNVAMTILAEVVLSGGEAVPDGSIVAAFVGQELRGKQVVADQQGRFLANLTVNVDANGETLSFKLWNSSTREISDCAATIPAQGGQSIGTPEAPVELHFGLVQQTLSLQPGWNHISFYTGFSDDSPDAVFAPVMARLDKIISDGKNYTPGWGQLNTLRHLLPGLGHWVNMSSSAELVVSGQPLVAADTPIALQAGWNNVAFIFDSPASVEGALAGILPLVEKVIGEGKNFTPGWGALNSLTQLNPGKGYWIKVSAATALIYQNAGLTRSTRGDSHSELRSQAPWTPVQYPSTPYTLLASVRLDAQPAEAGDWVGVFVGDECRAAGEMIPGNGMTYTNLTVTVNTNGEKATFKFYDAGTGAILDGTVEVTLTSGGTQGTPDSPFLLEFAPRVVHHAVTFVPGEHGKRVGGGELQQLIAHGEAALAPEIEASPGWQFTGWEPDFDCIVAPITVHAVYQALPAYDFDFAVQVSWDSGITYTLQMKAGPNASDEYVFGEDQESDLPLPPLPSPAAEEAFFRLPESDVKLLRDIHFLDDAVDALSWTLVVAVPEGNPATLTWDSLAIPVGWRLGIAQQSGRRAGVDMAAESSLIIEAAGVYTFHITGYREGVLETFTYHLNAGWNMICATLELTAEAEAYLLELGLLKLDVLGVAYTLATSVTPGNAYWLFSATELILQVEGLPVLDFALAIQPGWNFVGPVHDAVLPSAGLVAWEWTPEGYRAPPTIHGEFQLQAGKGYWVYWPDK